MDRVRIQIASMIFHRSIIWGAFLKEIDYRQSITLFFSVEYLYRNQYAYVSLQLLVFGSRTTLKEWALVMRTSLRWSKESRKVSFLPYVDHMRRLPPLYLHCKTTQGISCNFSRTENLYYAHTSSYMFLSLAVCSSKMDGKQPFVYYNDQNRRRTKQLSL